MIQKETGRGRAAGPNPDGSPLSYEFPGNTEPPLPREAMPPIPAALLAQDPQDRRERIPDPTVKSVLPANLLAALGNTHINLRHQISRLLDLIDTAGWPEDLTRESFEPKDRPLHSALDFARENARLTWVLCGLVDTLNRSLGAFVRHDNGDLISMGDDLMADSDFADRVLSNAGLDRG